MLIHPWDSGTWQEAMELVRAHEFGLLIVPRCQDLPVVVPTQFVVHDDVTLLLHLARANPALPALQEYPTVMMAVTGPWAYIPSAWKAIEGEDPRRGIPTTYYSAVHLTCDAALIDDPDETLETLRRQLRRLEPGYDVTALQDHHRLLRGIRALRLTVSDVRAKFKYGGNVDLAHRQAVAEQLQQRGRPDDLAVHTQLTKRLAASPSEPAPAP